MRFSIAFADEAGRVDPPLMRLLSFLTEDGDVPFINIVPITRLDGFQFSGLSQLTSPWVLVDFTEFGWGWKQDTSYLWCRDRMEHEWFAGEEWQKLDAFIRDNPPLLTFQRELLRKDVADAVMPIDYLNYSAPAVADTEQQFAARPIDVLFNWGLSSHYRPAIHGDIFAQSVKLGYEAVCSQWDHLNEAIRRKSGSLWASIHTPHYARLGNEEMIHWFSKAKIVVAAPGEGVKTFRHGEVNNSVIAMLPDALAYSVNIKGVRLELEREAASLMDAVRHEHLYEVYRMNHAAADSLRPERYIPEYFIPQIQKRLECKS